MHRKDIPDTPDTVVKRKRNKKKKDYCQKLKGEHSNILVVNDIGFAWGYQVDIICKACGHKKWHLWSEKEIEEYKSREKEQ